MKLEDVYIMEAKKHFESDGRPKESLPLVVRNMIGVYSELNNIKYTTRKRKSSIAEISAVKCSIPFYVQSPVMKKSKGKNTFLFEHRSGMFKIVLKNGKIGYIAFFDSGFGKSRTTESLLISEKDFVQELYMMRNFTAKRMSKPKPGIYKAFKGQFGVEYEKYSPKESIVIHPMVDKVEQSVKTHFDRLEKRKFFDRKILLYSQIGTGKTEFIKNLANKYKSTHSVVFTDNIAAMIEHQMKCAKYKVPTIIMLEEAEEAISRYNPDGGASRLNSSVKNALSGFMHEKNTAGCVVIMTTNFPERINKTVTERRERVDEMYEFGGLEGNYALDCVKLYIGEERYKNIESHKKELLELFNGLTGVEIKYICEDSVEHCDANEKDLTINTFNEVKSKRINSIKNMHSFKSDAPVYQGTQRNSVGFGEKNKNYDFNVDSFEF